MFPNHFVIEWDEVPVGVEFGFPFKTYNPNRVRFWVTRDEAEKYIRTFLTSTILDFHGPSIIIREIRFKIRE